MSHTVKLSDETYEFVTGEAARLGLTADVWIEQRLSSAKKKRPSETARQKAVKNYVGAFDSSRSDVARSKLKGLSASKKLDRMFGQILAAKMRKQGLKIGK